MPDPRVSPEQTIASQTEMSQSLNQSVLAGAEGGKIEVKPDFKIDEEEPSDNFTAVEITPQPVKVVKPEYPEIARRANLEGRVFVKVLVDKRGRAIKAQVLKSDAEVFNEPAIRAVLQWVFTPAMMNNGPVAVWAVVPMRFELNK